MCNKLSKGAVMVLGWQCPTPGTGGELKDHRATTDTIHTCFTLSFISMPPPPTPKIISPELLVRKKLLNTEGPVSKWAGAGEGWVCVLVFQGGRTGFCTKRKAGVAKGRLPACMYVYICTYTLSSTCTFNSYTRIHAHTLCRLEAPLRGWAYV